jgi:hypothetical protein
VSRRNCVVSESIIAAASIGSKKAVLSVLSKKTPLQPSKNRPFVG